MNKFCLIKNLKFNLQVRNMRSMSFETYKANEKGSFASLTMKKRVPELITNIIDSVHRKLYELQSDKDVKEGKEIISKLSEFKYKVERNKNLESVSILYSILIYCFVIF